MQYSYSRVETFEKCPHQFQLRYLKKLETYKDYEADNALIIGTALHTGIEIDTKTAIDWYYNQFPIITDLHVNEAIKLEHVINKARDILPQGKHELEINTFEFKGFIDLIVDNADGTVDIYDFKYSNNIDRYLESKQLHIYKYYYEALHKKKVRNLVYVFAPKVQIRQKKTEDLYQFRKRLRDTLEQEQVKLVPIPYNESKIDDFTGLIKQIKTCKDYTKNETRLCDWCEYKNLCLEGDNLMIKLPENKRREVTKISKKVVWIYGAPFSGKTTFANQFPDPIMLNTDGNIKFVDAPFIAIKDEITATERTTNRKFAWEVFLDTVLELEKKQNEFKTIVVDLLEDLYEYCRVYMYDKLGIEHESDNSFKAWDMVRNEYLRALKRLINLDYENIILISHEDTSKDITKKAGDKITKIAPNIQEKLANKIAGMVDITARVIADGDERYIEFKANEVVFGGGRLGVNGQKIDLDLEQFIKIYDEANVNLSDEPIKSELEEKSEETQPEEPKKVRKTRK